MEYIIAIIVLVLIAVGIWYLSRRVRGEDSEHIIPGVTKAAQSGDVFAQYKLASMYYEGKGVQPDSAEAARWYLKAARQGHVEAQFILGIMHERGDGVDRDNDRAYQWISTAAQQGHPRARTLLESDKWLLYLDAKTQESQENIDPGDRADAPDTDGRSPEVTREQMEEYTRKAEEDDVDAQYNLGVIYYHGEGVPRDFDKAYTWFRKAAEQDDADAQYNLGFMYGRGEGVQKDRAQSLQWFKRAAEQGHNGARAIIEKMTKNTVVPARKQ